MRRALLLLVLPLLYVAPSLAPGRAFLPQIPVGFEPLAAESPSAAREAWSAANYLASDRLFPALTDELAIRAQLGDGHWPLWQPLQGLGAPLLGGTIVGPLYPPNWLRYALGPVDAAPWCALLALFLAGLGAWLLLERRELSFAACAVGALAYQGGGWASANLHYEMKVDAALWLPWSLWAVEGVLARTRRSELWLAASSALSFLAGFPPVAVFCALASMLYAALRALEQRRGARVAGRVVVFVALGVGVAAAQLLPMLEASHHSWRGRASPAELDAQALPLASAATLVAPTVLGDPRSTLPAARDPLVWLWSSASESERAANANALEGNLFAGAAVVALAFVGALFRARRVRAELVLALVALAFVQGWPLVAQLYRVPGLDLGSPARAACVAWLALPLLAAHGVQALIERVPRAAATAVTLGLLLAVAGAALAAWAEPERWALSIHAAIAERHGLALETVQAELPHARLVEAAMRVKSAGVVLGLSAVAFALAVLLNERVAARRFAELGALVLALPIAGESLAVARAHLPALPSTELFPASEAMRALAAAAGDGRVIRFDASASGVDDVQVLARPNLPEAYGIADLTPYVVFAPRRAAEMLAALDPRTRYRSGASRIADNRTLAHPLLDLLRVTAVLARTPIEHPRLELAWSRPGFFVYRRSGSFAPARVVPVGITTGSDAVALGLLSSGWADARAVTVLAPGVPHRSHSEATAPFTQGELRAARPAPDRFDVAVRGSSGGWLVMHEAWAPGWSATIDGEPARLYRADHACRAVFIPPGDCVVRTEYEPASVPVGCALALISTALAVFLARRR